MEVAPTGEANIGATNALEQQRIAAAKLSDEKRLFPERFKASTTVNTGGGFSANAEPTPF